MAFWNRKEKRAASIETETVPVSAENFLAFFGAGSPNLPPLTIEAALDVPAVWAAVAFMSRTLATVPLHAYRNTSDGPVRIKGKLETIIHEAPAPGWPAEKFWRWFWQQVFTGGRGLAWIERSGPASIEAIWPMDPSKVSIRWSGMTLVYKMDGKDYPAEDVIDIAFMLKANGVDHYGPLAKAGGKAARLSAAMNEYASNFFAGGGIPPLALSGPLPQGPEALRRAMNDIHRSIEAAKSSEKSIFPMPPGHELKPVGFDPDKGQMTDARRFQVEEIARVYQLPPVFIQDLTNGTFSNTEQAGLQLVKHLIGQWCQALEDELNLKLFGRFANGRYVEHNLDGLMRGDFVNRMNGLAQAVQNGIMTPNEARVLEGRPALPHGDDLMIQGATVPIGSQTKNGEGNEPGTTGTDGAA